MCKIAFDDSVNPLCSESRDKGVSYNRAAGVLPADGLNRFGQTAMIRGRKWGRV